MRVLPLMAILTVEYSLGKKASPRQIKPSRNKALLQKNLPIIILCIHPTKININKQILSAKMFGNRLLMISANIMDLSIQGTIANDSVNY